MKPILALALATSLAVACSETSPPQSASAGEDQTAPASSARTEPPPAPAANPPPSTPAAGPAPGGTEPATGQAQAATATPRPPAAEAVTPRSAAPPPPPLIPPAPRFREVTIPAGTSLSVTILSTLASNTSKVEDPVRASLAKAVVVDGRRVLPVGAEMRGSVIDVHESGRVKGKASIAFRFDRIVAHGETYRIQTARVTREAAQDKKSDIKKGGIGGGIGAVVGGVIGGGKGAAIGAVAGGTGAVLGTKGNEVQLAPGTAATVLLQEALNVRVPIE